ncbi:hypothetical protein S83_020749, partial [Arachis hypogaea]
LSLASCSCFHWLFLLTFLGKIMSINEDDVKNDSDNDLGNNFDYQPNAEDDAEDDDVDSLDSTSKSEEVCGVKRIADLMVEDIWNLDHVLCAMKFENILEFSDSLIYKRWTKNAKNEFFSIEMPVHDDVERVLKFRVGALASNCNKLCDIACKDLADFDEVQFELLNLVIRLQSRKQGKSTPNVNVEGINDPFVVKSKGAPSKRSSWRKKRACFNCHKYGHYYKRCPDLMQHSVQGNPRNRSDGNASAKDSGFSPERFANSSRSFSVKSEHHSGPKTKPFKKGGTRKFTAKGMRNQKGKDNTFDERSLHESSESIDIASMNGFFNKNLYSLTQ